MSTPRIRVTTLGNVGIGMGASLPLQRLHVAGDVTMDAGSAYKIGNSDVLSATALGNSVITSNLQTVGNLVSLGITGGNVNLGNGAVVMASGKMGINSPNPSYALDVGGTVNVTGNYRVNGNVFPEVSTSTYDGYIPSNFGDPNHMFPENTADTTSMGGFGLGTYSNDWKWEGGVLAPNGKIYGIPRNSASVLIIDPLANTADTTTITGLGSGGYKWFGGVLGPNGKIYGIPVDSTSVLIIDPVTNSTNTTTITGLSGSTKWHAGVLAPNGKIYGIPFESASVLIIDPVTNTANTTAITGLTGGAKWVGCVLAPNGKIYCIPFRSTSVLIIDPVTNTVNTTTITGLSGDGKWVGGVLAPNGKIYCIPHDSTSVLIIDPASDTANITTITGLSNAQDKWSGGVLASNGKIYGMPRLASSVMILKTGLPTMGQDWMLQAEFNKF